MMEQEKPGLGRAAETIFGWAIQDNQSEAVKLRMDSDITKPDPKSTGNATWVSWGDLLPKYNLPDFQALEFIRKGDLPAYDKEYSNRINRDSRHLTPAALTEIAVFREQDIFGLHGKDATDPTATHTKALVSWQNLIQRIPLFTVDGKTSSEQTASHSKKDRLLAYAKALIDSGSVNTRPELAEKVQKGLPEWKDNDPEYIIDLTRELWPDYTKYKPGRKAKRDT